MGTSCSLSVELSGGVKQWILFSECGISGGVKQWVHLVLCVWHLSGGVKQWVHLVL